MKMKNPEPELVDEPEDEIDQPELVDEPAEDEIDPDSRYNLRSRR